MFETAVVEALAPHVPLDSAVIGALLAAPPDPSLGDVAFPCFSLAKALRKAPAAIAADLAAAVTVAPPLAAVTAAGPYVNFRLDRAEAGARLLAEILAGDAWGGSDEGAGQTVCIDFCSPNVARRMHLGHLRSTVIGKSLARLHEAHGFRVVRINFLGDWGTQFGKLIAAWQRWGDAEAAAADPIGELQRLYVQFHNAAKADPTLEDEARACFKRLEDGDPEARRLWAWIRELSLTSMKSTLGLLGVGFDDYTGEAFYEGRNQAVVDQLRAQGLLTESDGALVVDLGPDLPPCLILKADGATLYPTRDIAAALHRQEQYQPARSLYVVDLGQALHFRQVFATLRRMGLPWAGRLEHIGFGIMRVGGKRLRTRAGDVVYLEDVLGQAIAMARAELEARSPGMAGAEEVARSIGVGAVIFHDLKQNRVKDIDYNPDEAISFEGETGPYVQYAHARCRNVLRKAGLAEGELPPVTPHAAFGGAPEWALLTALAQFPAAVRDAMRRCEPHLAARAVLDIARALSQFYHESPVLRAEPGVKAARLALVAAAGQVLRRGLWLLGLEAPPMRED